MRGTNSYHRFPFPKIRRSSIDAGKLSQHKHVVHGLLEIDVSSVMSFVHTFKKEHGEKLSITAILVHALAQAIERHPEMHAYLDWRNRIVIFDQVNIIAMTEVDYQGTKVPVRFLFKDVNQSTLLEIHSKLRQVQASPADQGILKQFKWFYRLPGFARRLISRMVMKFPTYFRHYSSAVMVTPIGMFGNQPGWGIPSSTFTTTITVGSIFKKPWVVDHRILPRDILHLTVSINHDIVDGAPATRFIRDLVEILQSLHSSQLESVMGTSVSQH